MLVLCCLLWGYSFPVMQLSMDMLGKRFAEAGGLPVQAEPLHELGLTAAFLGWRFGLAALATALLWGSARSGFKRVEIRSGFFLGLIFAVGMICQLAGLRYTLPSVSSFITSLTVVFTPLAQALIFRRSVGAWTWLGVALALGGMTVLSQPNPGACLDCRILPVPPIPYLGEALTTLGAVFFTALILGLDRLGSRCDPARLSLAMFCSSAVCTSLIGWLLCGSALYRTEVVGVLAHDFRFVELLLTLTLFSSVLAIHLMYRYQQFVSPAVASVIYATESVFATLFSLIFGTERLTVNTVVGGTLILAAFALVTLPRSADSVEGLNVEG